ncbi:SDR family oxidoreductase [Nonomuraea sp. NPDC050022]|uniref:NAD(P)-dependent oxidoreductase n=1 Tax=unclassified Nonomuraea TaxID=2593643 RepID=UPI0033E813CF
MKLTIFGATGGTGTELLRQALAAGHEVTAVVRDPRRLPADLPSGLDIVQADLMNPDAIAPAVRDRDAVLSAMGAGSRGPTTVCSDSISAIATAMARGRTRRVLMTSASGLVADAGDGVFTRYVLKPLLVQRLLKHAYADLREAERRLRATDLDWTIVRPSRLTDRGLTGRYRTAWDTNIKGGLSTTRADTAHCLLALAADPMSVRHAVSVAS